MNKIFLFLNSFSKKRNVTQQITNACQPPMLIEEKPNIHPRIKNFFFH